MMPDASFGPVMVAPLTPPLLDPSNPSLTLDSIVGSGGGQMEAEGTTNESSRLVGGGGGQREAEGTPNESS
jgi:hypothetical protein